MIFSNVFFRLYGLTSNAKIRRLVRWIVGRAEGGQFYSLTLRRIFETYHQVSIGLYTHGSCFNVGQIDRYTSIGRFCSIAANVRVFNRNHPMEFKSTHAFFFNPKLGICAEDSIDYIPLTIGNDVWVGDGAIIMPHVKEINDGAVIAAGSVVNKNVPPYAVVVGNPARVVRYRFTYETIQKLLATRWWDQDISEISKDLSEYTVPYTEE